MKKILHKLFYVKTFDIQENDSQGNIIRPYQEYYIKRFFWRNPFFKGYYEEDEKKPWYNPFGIIFDERAGLQIYNGFLHVSIWHWLKYRIIEAMCLGRHDFGGMFDSCSRCGKVDCSQADEIDWSKISERKL